LKSTDEKLMICSIHLFKNPPNLAKLVFTPLQEEQGGKNFTPFVLSLQYAKKNLKNNIFPYGWRLAQKCLSVVCCLLSACDEFVPNYILKRWSDWDIFFFTKTRENLYLRISILKFRGQHPRVEPLE
jgi:hypothetical protein